MHTRVQKLAAVMLLRMELTSILSVTGSRWSRKNVLASRVMSLSTEQNIPTTVALNAARDLGGPSATTRKSLMTCGVSCVMELTKRRRRVASNVINWATSTQLRAHRA